MLAPAPPLTIKCGPCVRIDHANCTGRASGCRCNLCPGRHAEIMADARHRAATSNSTGLLRQSVEELLALMAQKNSWFQAMAAKPTRASFCPECGERLVILPWGRPRETCSRRCRNARYWRRRKERLASEREAAEQHAA